MGIGSYLHSVGKGNYLCGANEGEIKWIKEEDQVFAFEIGETDLR